MSPKTHKKVHTQKFIKKKNPQQKVHIKEAEKAFDKNPATGHDTDLEA